MTNLTKSRSWCGTWNNYTQYNYDNLINDERWVYIIIGKEIGDQGTPHLQFYARTKNAIRFSTLKAAYPQVHWEQAKGTVTQNVDYCSKQGNFEEKGEKPDDLRQARGKLQQIFAIFEMLEEQMCKHHLHEVAHLCKDLTESMIHIGYDFSGEDNACHALSHMCDDRFLDNYDMYFSDCSDDSYMS